MQHEMTDQQLSERVCRALGIEPLEWQELRMWMDSQQGRVVTANALIEEFRKADPELTARIVG